MSSLTTRSVCLTCTEGGEDDSVVERLRRAVVVLQKHPVRILRFTGVQYRLHPQELWWTGDGDRGAKKHFQSSGTKLKTSPEPVKVDRVESSAMSLSVTCAFEI